MAIWKYCIILYYNILYIYYNINGKSCLKMLPSANHQSSYHQCNCIYVCMIMITMIWYWFFCINFYLCQYWNNISYYIIYFCVSYCYFLYLVFNACSFENQSWLCPWLCCSFVPQESRLVLCRRLCFCKGFHVSFPLCLHTVPRSMKQELASWQANLMQQSIRICSLHVGHKQIQLFLQGKLI